MKMMRREGERLLMVRGHLKVIILFKMVNKQTQTRVELVLIIAISHKARRVPNKLSSIMA